MPWYSFFLLFFDFCRLLPVKPLNSLRQSVNQGGKDIKGIGILNDEPKKTKVCLDFFFSYWWFETFKLSNKQFGGLHCRWTLSWRGHTRSWRRLSSFLWFANRKNSFWKKMQRYLNWRSTLIICSFVSWKNNRPSSCRWTLWRNLSKQS